MFGRRTLWRELQRPGLYSKQLEIPNFDLEAKNRSGRWMWVSMSTIVFENSRNHRRLVVHLAHDITARKKNEDLTGPLEVFEGEKGFMDAIAGCFQIE
jgi:hypothetical protein